MKETGLICTTESVKAFLEGRKTQTRRLSGLDAVNQNPDAWQFINMEGDLAVFRLLKKHWGDVVPARSRAKVIRGKEPNLEFLYKCPYGQVGDKVWVRETIWEDSGDLYYKADWGNEKPVNMVFDKGKWRSGRFMPKSAARIWREIIGLGVERLQEINKTRHDEVLKEGYPFGYDIESLNENPVVTFANHWDSVNAKRGHGWDRNEWVFVLKLKISGDKKVNYGKGI